VSAPARRSGSFLRVLGVGFGLAVICGNTIGTGILNGPGIVAGQASGMWAFLAMWIVVGACSLIAAPSLAEVAAMMPRAGGYYIYAKRAFDGFPAFLVGWTDWLVSSGAIAASAVAFAAQMVAVVPALRPWLLVVAVALVAALALLQLSGIRSGSLLQDVMSALTAVAFLAFLAICFLAPTSAGATVASAASQPVPVTAGLGAALLTVLYAYDGWDGALYFGEEVRDPGRDIPRAMIAGVVALTALYLLVNGALIHVLTFRVLAGRENAIQLAAVALFGTEGGRVASAAMMVVFASGASACLLIASRIIAALGADAVLPQVFARVNVNGTPGPALLLTALAAVVFILIGQTIQRLMESVGLLVLVTGVLTLSAVIILRRREPDALRPYRTWGYPATTIAALLVSVALLVGNVLGDPTHTAYALLVVAASYPAYRLRARVSRRNRQRTLRA